MKGYRMALKARSPSLMVSRLIRLCFTSDTKLDCDVNDNKNDTNFLWRLGKDKDTDEEKVKEGREILDTLIGMFTESFILAS